MAKVQKAILFLDDGTTEEYTTFIGDFINLDDNVSNLVVGHVSDSQLAWSMTRMNYKYKQFLEKRLK